MKIDLEMTVNGQRAKSGDVERMLHREAQRAMLQDIVQKVGHLRCAEHGRSPRIDAKQDDEAEVTFCCEALKDQAMQVLD